MLISSRSRSSCVGWKLQSDLFEINVAVDQLQAGAVSTALNGGLWQTVKIVFN